MPSQIPLENDESEGEEPSEEQAGQGLGMDHSEESNAGPGTRMNYLSDQDKEPSTEEASPGIRMHYPSDQNKEQSAEEAGSGIRMDYPSDQNRECPSGSGIMDTSQLNSASEDQPGHCLKGKHLTHPPTE